MHGQALISIARFGHPDPHMSNYTTPVKLVLTGHEPEGCPFLGSEFVNAPKTNNKTQCLPDSYSLEHISNMLKRIGIGQTLGFIGAKNRPDLVGQGDF